MKKVLILVISSQHHPYGEMITTSQKTWDSVDIVGCETIFFCGEPVGENTDKIIYFPINESLHTMGHKTISAFRHALVYKEFDYIARVNSSTYVDKLELVKYIQTLPDKNVFEGLVVPAGQYPHPFMWGPAFILSKDVVQNIIHNKDKWDHSLMDDVAISLLLEGEGVPFRSGKMASIDKIDGGFRCMGYGGGTFEFLDWKDIKKAKGQYFFRCKQDYDRRADRYVMEKLFENL